MKHSDLIKEKLKRRMENINLADNANQYGNGNVVAKSYGRAGNQMFISSVAASYAKKTGRNFVGLIKSSYYPENDINVYKTILRNVTFLEQNELNLDDYENKGTDLSIGVNGYPDFTKPNVLFDGYYQNANLIDKEVAYDMFQPTEEILVCINNLYGDLSNYVCVNVRRGDFLKYKNLHHVLSKEEILCMLNKHFPNENKILFVSDDIEWCKENFIGDRYSFADKPYETKPFIDLYIQTLCKGNIISTSTFSWWGAYLNKRTEKVVCRWPWFDNYEEMGTCEHLLPKEWIKENFI